MPPTCLLTVVIPCYNAAPYLPAAVDSVLAQQVDGSEILIVDDCSTDDSVAVAESLARQHPQVQSVRQPANAGPAHARNQGLQLAHGHFICFLDADDTYAPQFFRTVLADFQEDPRLAAISTEIELVNCHRKVHPLQLRSVVGSLPSNLLMRRGVAELLGGFPGDTAFRGKAAGEDATFRQALGRYFRTSRRPESFLRYLIRPGSHFHHFLDRSEIRDGRVHFTRKTEEERNGSLTKAMRDYFVRAEDRIEAFKRAQLAMA